MNTISINKYVNAPAGLVFKTVSDIRNFSEAIPDIINVEFLTKSKYGVGTKFKETRKMNGHEASTVLEVTELEKNSHIRLVSDAGGTIWDSVFEVEEMDGATRLGLKMEAKPYKFMAKLFTPLMKNFIKNAVEKDMLAVKKHCENNMSDY